MRLRLCCLTIAVVAACSNAPDEGSTEQAICDCTQDPLPCCCNSPIVIDVAGDGIELTSWADGVVFALRPGKPAGGRAWTHANSDDAWLVLDWNEDGVINDGGEMFGNMSPQPAPAAGQLKNGFAALAEHDGGDQLIDDRDPVFASLRLWQDQDHDGVSQPGELHTLPELGVAGISVDYAADRVADKHGNSFRYRAAVHGTPGSTVGMTAWDVWLTGPVGTPQRANLLPADRWACTCKCFVYAMPPASMRACDVPGSMPSTPIWYGRGFHFTSQTMAKAYCRSYAFGSAQTDVPNGEAICARPPESDCFDYRCVPPDPPPTCDP
jgi:hypothetical protein